MMLTTEFKKEIYTNEALFFYPIEELKTNPKQDTQSLYKIEKIIDYMYDYEEKEHYYFIKWLNYNYNYNSWEPLFNLGGCEQLIDNYHKNNKKKVINYTFKYKKNEVYEVITSPEYKEKILENDTNIVYPSKDNQNLILNYPYKIYNKKANENVKREIRFVKIKNKEKDIDEIFVTHDLFHILKSKTNFSREIRSYTVSENEYNILKLKVPDLNHNTQLGQIQFVVSFKIVNIFCEKYYSHEYQDYFDWIYSEVDNFMDQ